MFYQSSFLAATIIINVCLCLVLMYTLLVYACSNEKDVGRGLKKSGIPRSDIFVVTKVWGDGHGYERCKKAFADSLRKYADS